MLGHLFYRRRQPECRRRLLSLFLAVTLKARHGHWVLSLMNDTAWHIITWLLLFLEAQSERLQDASDAFSRLLIIMRHTITGMIIYLGPYILWWYFIYTFHSAPHYFHYIINSITLLYLILISLFYFRISHAPAQCRGHYSNITIIDFMILIEGLFIER